jgi:signal peptidase I
MEPRLHSGDRLVVDKLSYRLRDVRRGDVVLVDTSAIPAMARPDGDSIVKRIIGLPGERIEAVDGKVLVDDEHLDESWLGDDVLTPDFGPLLVPDGSVLVLGDNRATSIDGRTFGAIPIDAIIGRAEWVIWPLGDVGRL